MEKTKVFAEMTKAEKFGVIAEVAGVTEEQKEFLYKEIEALKKKNSYKSKADKEKESQNVTIEEHIKSVLKDSAEPMTTAQIATTVGTLMGIYMSTQKIVPRCKSLVEQGYIMCESEKKVNKYKVAE